MASKNARRRTRLKRAKIRRTPQTKPVVAFAPVDPITWLTPQELPWLQAS